MVVKWHHGSQLFWWTLAAYSELPCCKDSLVDTWLSSLRNQASPAHLKLPPKSRTPSCSIWTEVCAVRLETLPQSFPTEQASTLPGAHQISSFQRPILARTQHLAATAEILAESWGPVSVRIWREHFTSSNSFSVPGTQTSNQTS